MPVVKRIIHWPYWLVYFPANRNLISLCVPFKCPLLTYHSRKTLDRDLQKLAGEFIFVSRTPSYHQLSHNDSIQSYYTSVLFLPTKNRTSSLTNFWLTFSPRIFSPLTTEDENKNSACCIKTLFIQEVCHKDGSIITCPQSVEHGTDTSATVKNCHYQMPDFIIKTQEIRFWAGLFPKPNWRAHSAPQTLSWIWGTVVASGADSMGHGGGTCPHFYKWPGTGGTVSRGTANKIYWPKCTYHHESAHQND